MSSTDSAISSLTFNGTSPDAGLILRTEEIEFCTNGRTKRTAIEDDTTTVEDTDINILGGRSKGSTTIGFNVRSPRLPKLTEGHLTKKEWIRTQH